MFCNANYTVLYFSKYSTTLYMLLQSTVQTLYYTVPLPYSIVLLVLALAPFFTNMLAANKTAKKWNNFR